ncbi:MAG: CpsD/CapB family tyrosine-protein kinase [Planctomycetota bacterium]
MRLFGQTSESSLEPAPPGEGVDIPIRSEEIVMVRDPYSQVAEQFRRLRNSIQALNSDGASRTVMMTSSIRGEGKTVATLNLAIALAELPQMRVLVLDVDHLSPQVENYLGLPRRQGLTEVLQGRLPLDQSIRNTAIERMDVMGAGSAPLNPADILNVDRIRSVLNALKRRYDYVLIDAPAALSTNSPSVLGSLADGIILVVRLGSTPKPLVEEAYQSLENLGGNILGTCLTDGSLPDSGR